MESTVDGNGRSAIFIDAGNTHGAQKILRWKIDFPKALRYFGKDRDIWGAYYFSSIPPARNLITRNRYIAFRNVLINAGYTVIDKEMKIIVDQKTKAKRKKANLDVEFTMHVMSTMNAWQEAIFFTGDSDFAPLAMYLRMNGKEITCVSTRACLSREMKNAANNVIDLKTIRQHIERKRQPQPGVWKKGS